MVSFRLHFIYFWVLSVASAAGDLDLWLDSRGINPACVQDHPAQVLGELLPHSTADMIANDRAATLAWAGKAFVSLQDYAAATVAFDDSLAVALSGNHRDQEPSQENIRLALEIYNDYSTLCYRLGHYGLAIQLENQVIGLAEHFADRHALARGYNNLGVLHRKVSDPYQARDYYLKALAIRQTAGHQQGIAQTLNNLSIIEKNLGNFAAALDYQSQAIDIEEALGKGPGLARSYGNLGQIYVLLSKTDEALEVHQKALAIQTEYEDRMGLALSLNRIGELLIKQNKLVEAESKLKQALAINQALDYTSGIATSQANLSQLANALGDPSKAIDHCNRYLLLSEQLGNRHMIAEARLRLADLYLQKGQTSTALDHLQAGYAEARQVNDRPRQLEAAKTLAGIYADLGQWQQAFRFQNETLTLTRALFNREQQKRTAIENQLAMDRNQNEIALLTRDNRIQALEIHRQRLMGKLLIAGLAILLGLLVLVIVRIRSINQARALLNEKNQHIEEKSRQLEHVNQRLRAKAEETDRINRDLYRASVTDALTGAYNRSYLTDFFRRELSNCRRHNLDLSFFMIDIDYFKEVNDRWGHLTGDKVLKETVEIIRQNLRKEDLVSRYGGEEFMVVLPNTKREQALAVAEKIRRTIKDHTFVYGQTRLKISISIGVADLRSCNAQTVDQLIRCADEALYEAKHKGRNQAILFHT